MHFAVSGVEVSPIIPPLVAFAISFLTSMGGVSGAFLLLPFQVSVLGFASPSVSATNQLFNIVAIPTGVMRYIREGRMVWPLAWVVVLGTLPGVLIGALARVKYMPDRQAFTVFAGCVLLFIGLRMVQGLIGGNARLGKAQAAESRFAQTQRAETSGGAAIPPSAIRVHKLSFQQIAYEFEGELFEFPVWGVFGMSFVVGIVGGAYGIGGGAIVAPFFVSVFGLPVYTIAGAALLGTLVTSIVGVVFYQAIAPLYPTMSVAPDWALGILFGAGGAAGMYCGARLQRYIPARLIKWMLAAIIIGVACKYIVSFIISG